MNYLVIDTEYSNFNCIKGDMIQISCIAIINGEEKESFTSYLRPLKPQGWSEHAEAVHGISLKKSKDFMHPKEVAENFRLWITKFDFHFTCMGWSCAGDKKYIEKFVRDYGIANDWHIRTRPKWLDVHQIAKKKKSSIGVENFKLGTVCKFFNVELKAHDAYSDALATWKVYELVEAINVARTYEDVKNNNMSELEKRKKYLDMKYVTFNGDGEAFITKHATENKDALGVVLSEIWERHN